MTLLSDKCVVVQCNSKGITATTTCRNRNVKKKSSVTTVLRSTGTPLRRRDKVDDSIPLFAIIPLKTVRIIRRQISFVQHKSIICSLSSGTKLCFRFSGADVIAAPVRSRPLLNCEIRNGSLNYFFSIPDSIVHCTYIHICTSSYLI